VCSYCSVYSYLNKKVSTLVIFTNNEAGDQLLVMVDGVSRSSLSCNCPLYVQSWKFHRIVVPFPCFHYYHCRVTRVGR